MNPALEAALALARTPTLVHGMRRQPLPPGVSSLLRIVAGEAGAVQEAADDSGRDERHLTSVAELYVQQVLLFSGAEPYRVMGVQPGTERQEMRKNLRWLMTWLHPDKNAAEWRSVFASRVLEAWNAVSSPGATDEPDLEANCQAPVRDMDSSSLPAQFSPEKHPFKNPAPWKQAVPDPQRPRRIRRRRTSRPKPEPVFIWPKKIPRGVVFILIMIALAILGAYLLN